MAEKQLYPVFEVPDFVAKKNEENRYVFETQSQNSTAKSPMGAFESFEIDNDMAMVLKALEDF